MRNELEIFKNEEFGEIRTVEINGEPYFVAVDIAKTLGYKNTNDAIIRHCRWVVKHDIPHPQSRNKTLEVNVIPEGDLYRLITGSDLPSAKEFESWVYDEVLPTLRQTNSYEIPREEKKQPNQVESLTIKEVKFLDDVLRVGQDKQGRIFVGVNDICKSLGMNKARKDKEIIAVQKDETLKKGCKKFPCGTFYGFGSAITLQLDYIPLWLTKIKITPSMRANNPNAANKLVEYQSQAKGVLAAAFFANNTLATYPPALSHYTASAVAELGRITKSIMEKQGSSPRKIAEIFKLECQQFGIYLPEDFVEMPIYEQLSLDINEIITR